MALAGGRPLWRVGAALPTELRGHALPGRGARLVTAASDQQPDWQPQLPRFYVPATLEGAEQGAVLRLPPDEARHAAKTLRLRPGDRLELCDGAGRVALAELGQLDRAGAAVLTLEAARQVPLADRWRWEVACACGSLKGGRSDWLVEKCAELGAAALTPLLTHRSPAIGGGGDDDRPARRGSKQAGRRRGSPAEPGEEDAGGGGSGREARWERVATAAMKQSLRAHAMRVSPPCTVPQLCERVRGADAALVGVAGAPPLHQAAAPLAAAARAGGRGGPPLRGLICVGPEGDWTAEEVAELEAAGALPVGLGPLRLRAETAAVALLAYTRLHLL